MSDYDAVANLLERALEVGLTEPHARVRVQAELGTPSCSRGAWVTRTVLAEAHETAANLGERAVAAGALVRRGWNRTGDPRSRTSSRRCARKRS